MTRAAELRIAGLTYEAIADRLGYKTRDGAHKAVTTILRERTQHASEELEVLEDERLDFLLRKALTALAKAETGQVASLINAALRVSERRAKLHGLDQPAKVQVQASMDEQTREAVNRVRADYGLDAADDA